MPSPPLAALFLPPFLQPYSFQLVIALVVFLFIWYFFLPVSVPPSPLRSLDLPEPTAPPNEGEVRRHYRYRKSLVTTPPNTTDITTVPDLFAKAVEKYGSRSAVGSRRTVKIDYKMQKTLVDGVEQEKKLSIPWQTPYEYNTYTQCWDEMKLIQRGILRLLPANRLKGPSLSRPKVALFASTRKEWQLAAQALFSLGMPIVTIYPSLGLEALIYSLKLCEVEYIITQASLLDIVGKAAQTMEKEQKEHLRGIIHFDDVSGVAPAMPKGVSLISYKSIITGATDSKESKSTWDPPKPEDIAVIMFTSGSTGLPKGVMMSHANIIASYSGITSSILPDPLTMNDVYIAFLPTAHVLELMAEISMLGIGGCIGYSSPTTLRDDTVCNDLGRPCGDLSALRPTLMASVPLILDRLRSDVTTQVNKASLVKKTLFRVCYYLKYRAYLRGWSSPLLDALVFKKVAAKFGGRLRFILSGGAPLASDTQKFMNIVFCCPILAGYGLTETMGGGTITHGSDKTTGNVGAPIASAEIKLIDVPEMGYTHRDMDPNEPGTPMPRGEIVIGGGLITMGYYGMDKADYRVDAKGQRWFYTGDIGKWNEDGTLSIIDRKKDLVKLQHGEYIALGSLESKFIASPYIDNICIYGDSFHTKCIGLIVVNHKHVQKAAEEEGLGSQLHHDIHQLCQHTTIINKVKESLEAIGKENKFQKFEVPAAFALLPDAWTPDSGLLTEAMKLKRHEIVKRFDKIIKDTYAKA